MILTGEQIRERGIISPHVPRSVAGGLSYGEGLAGYDIRLGLSVTLRPGRTTLGASLEHFAMPLDVLGQVCDKSTWARKGVFVQNTIIEPGWRGHLTLELTWIPLDETYLPETLFIAPGSPIAQIVFFRLERPTGGYSGKYQDQGVEPTHARFE